MLHFQKESFLYQIKGVYTFCSLHFCHMYSEKKKEIIRLVRKPLYNNAQL